MPDNENPSPEYLKGFNQGYLLEKETPELNEKIIQAMESHDSDIAKGLRAGREEYQKEKAKSKLPSWLKEGRISSLTNDEKTRDKEDLEPEK